MDRAPVSSSSIKSIGYDPPTSTLEVEFKSGWVYQYFSIPSDVFAQLMSASSKGRYFDQKIKDTYKFERIK